MIYNYAHISVENVYPTCQHPTDCVLVTGQPLTMTTKKMRKWEKKLNENEDKDNENDPPAGPQQFVSRWP